MTEILDIYDDNLRLLGTKPRSDVHRDGDWHCVFHCWVIYRDDDGKDWVIVQKRGADKSTFPNYLDVSAAGHYMSGETMHEGIRELHEELGLSAAFNQLIPVGRRVSTARYDDLIDREIADVFLYICDQPLQDYVYQEDELAGLVAINVADGLAMFSGKRETMPVSAVGLEESQIIISPADFVPAPDHYFYKILVLARRCLDDEEHLLI